MISYGIDVPNQIPDSKYESPKQLLWLLTTTLNWDNHFTYSEI